MDTTAPDRPGTGRRPIRAWICVTAAAALAVCAVAGPGTPAPAASLLSLDLTIDGSADPPGDRLDLAVYLLPGEDEIAVEVRAMTVAGEDNGEVRPVRARGPRHRDAQGAFLLAARFVRRTGSPLVRGRLAIPYADLMLPEGTHQLAYQVIGRTAGGVAFVRATELTRVTVSGRVRRKLEQRGAAAGYTVQTRKVAALVPGERIRGVPTKPERHEIALRERTPSEEITTKQIEVEIPGEYRREEVVEPGRPDAEPSLLDPKPDAWKGRPWRPLSEVESERERIVWFATNRNRIGGPDAPPRFGAEVADAITYGSATVNFPVDHTPGELEVPSWWQARDPEKHFLVEAVTVLAAGDFFERLAPGDVLLFVHGYRNTFDDAVLRAAQVKYDAGFPGKAAAFCWPSAGIATEYARDGQNAEKSATALAEVLRRLCETRPRPAARGESPKIHVIAHSMGNRVLLGAIYELYDAGHFEPGSKPLGQVVLAAPDVGALQFNNLLPYALEFAERVTYYYCGHDAALKASQGMNLYEPVGLLPFFERGLDTINADRAGTSFLGHSYFASSPLVLLDIQLMVNRGLAPAERMPPIASRSAVLGHVHWSFTPTEAREIRSEPTEVER